MKSKNGLCVSLPLLVTGSGGSGHHQTGMFVFTGSRAPQLTKRAVLAVVVVVGVGVGLLGTLLGSAFAH